MPNEPAPAPLIIGRRKFFSFFGAGVVMAAAPGLLFPSPVDYRREPLTFIQDYYGDILPVREAYQAWWLKNKFWMERIRSIEKHAR